MRLSIDPSLCGCGSGLRRVRCCEPDRALHLVDASEEFGRLLKLAAQAYRLGDPAAEPLCLQILDIAAGQRDALIMLYNIRRAQGQGGTAEVLIRRLVALDANDFWATNELGLLLMNKGDFAEAERHARNGVRIAPEEPQAHNLLGMILTEAHKPQLGEYHYRRVLQLSRARDPIVLANLAWNLKTQGKMQDARNLYMESAELAPNVRQTLLGWARLEEADRRFDAAEEILDRAQAGFPDDPTLLLARAVLLGRMGLYDIALATLDKIAQAGGDGALGPSELLEKGTLLERMGRYDEAFAAWDEAKRRARELNGEHYLAAQAQQLADRLKRFFTSRRLTILPRATVQKAGPKPIFILGFPRSGTTLVEQTLSAHSRISAGDELPFIEELTRTMPRLFDSPLTYPEALAELWMADHREGIEDLRDHYLRKVKQFGIIEPGAAWFTDKMPLNETHLGLISLLFPDAPLIHVLRHPLDVVLSVFANNLTHGFFCAYELETAALHYRLVLDLVEHYRREMTLRYLPVRYEDIVDDQETSVRRMLAFIGEDFDELCLRFHENRRYARTASYAQVTEKLYDRSRFRYRHYLKQLQPAIPILLPVIERLGYSIG